MTFEKRSQPTSSLPWVWRDVEIQSSQLISTAIAITTPQVQTSRKRTAHFTPSLTVSSYSQSPTSRSPSPGLAAKIDSLCRSLVAAHQQDCYLGVLEDEAWRHHVYSFHGPGSKSQIFETVSLSDIIYGAKEDCSPAKVPVGFDSCALCITLHDTTWLPHGPVSGKG